MMAIEWKLKMFQITEFKNLSPDICLNLYKIVCIRVMAIEQMWKSFQVNAPLNFYLDIDKNL